MSKPNEIAHENPAGKPDIAANAIYPVAARAALAELHANLLDMLANGLSPHKNRNHIVVVGPGSEVLPYSEHLDAVWKLLSGGNLILLDYNPDICGKIPAYLNQLGWSERFHIELLNGNDVIDPDLYSDSILVKQWNIRDGFPFPAASVDAIDMTVSMHHVTQYESDIEQLFRHVRKVLKPGALLHLGEGAVDMKFSERKIRHLANDVLKSGVAGVSVADQRYADAPPRQWTVGAERTDTFVTISADGMVEIRSSTAANIAAHLRSNGYKHMFVTEQSIVLPLIDHSMDADYREMIIPVREYYKTIMENALPRLDLKYQRAFLDALNKEQSDAVRGIVEYYSPPEMLCDSLTKCGFRIDQLRTTARPFVNIAASRP